MKLKVIRPFVLILVSLALCCSIASTSLAGLFTGWTIKKPLSFGDTGMGVTWRTPLGRNGAGVTWRTPLGKNNAGVTIQTPLGRNGLGYEPLKKPIPENLKRWATENREIIALVAVTIVAIAIVQPELIYINGAEVGVLATAQDGAAAGLALQTTQIEKAGQKAVVEKYNVPLWPLGLPSTIFEELRQRKRSGLDDPRITSLLDLAQTPAARKQFYQMIRVAEKMQWPANVNPNVAKQVVSILRNTAEVADFMKAYLHENQTLLGADKDRRLKRLREKGDSQLASMSDSGITSAQMRQCVLALQTELKRQAAEKKKQPAQKTASDEPSTSPHATAHSNYIASLGEAIP